jgi:hypothetical protein
MKTSVQMPNSQPTTELGTPQYESDLLKQLVREELYCHKKAIKSIDTYNIHDNHDKNDDV